MPKRRRRRSTPSILPLLIIGAGLLLIGAAGIWYVNQGDTASPVAQQAPVAGNATNPQVRIPYPDIARVSTADSRAALETDQAVILDVRGAQFYQDSHVAGAINIPEEELPNRLGELNQDDWIITYCT